MHAARDASAADARHGEERLDFESTLPLGRPDLVSVSAFQRYLDDVAAVRDLPPTHSGLASLSPSLWQDLMRFEAAGRAAELLEVVAAGLRHGHALAIHVQAGARVLPLTLYPRERQFHCPLPLAEVLSLRLSELQVMLVEPAPLASRGAPSHPLAGRREHFHPLLPLTWALALRGARPTLLPEIAGPLAYRVSPGVDLRGLGLSAVVQVAVRRLQMETVNLRRLAQFPGLDRERAQRLLNALYLHGALIVSRSHPAASDSWFVAL